MKLKPASVGRRPSPNSVRPGLPQAVILTAFVLTAIVLPAASEATSPGSYGFYTLTPCRVVDTRNAPGPNGGPPIAANSDRTFPIAGRCGIPSTAEAVALNVAVVDATTYGSLRIHPDGCGPPLASAINYSPGKVRANNGSFGLGPDGGLSIHSDQASGSVNVILDVSGYFETTAAPPPPPPPPSGGPHIWSEDFGGPNLSDSATPAGLAVDSAGASVVVGYLQWRTDFGGGLLTSAGSGDVYLAKYAANGSHLWSKRFGGTEDDRPKGVAVDSAGNVYITGLFRGSANFGGGVLTAPPFTANAFLAKYSPSGGHIWSLRLGTGPSEGTAVAVDGGGNVILAGNFYSTSDFGGGALTTAGGADIVLAKYSSSGAHVWSKRIGGASDDSALRVAVDTTTGEIVTTGFFGGSVNFGGGALASAGATDIFLAKYSSSGSHVWSRRWGGAQDDKGYGVALDQLGSAVVTGVFTGNVDFGGGVLTNPGGGDIFLVKYSVGGAHIWSRGYGSTTSVTDTGYGVDFDSAGRVLLTGSVGATIDFGGGPLTGDGWVNPILAKFGSDGSHVWSKRYSGGGAHANGRALAVDSGDNVLATGDFTASVNLGGVTLTSPGGTDTYLVKLGP